jgi:adenosylmethionine-8-amino-7-oxononanoate transaminase/dethiobiotin synthase
MSDFIVVGTDTDAGKTTFALLWLTAFGKRYSYWKPVETGSSDTESIRQLVPNASVFPPLIRLETPVAPPLAAKREGKSIPFASRLARSRPQFAGPLLIETFGGPLSPLNDSELQIKLIRNLGLPCLLVTSSSVGAVGRTLSALRAMRSEGVSVPWVVLLGPHDDYAVGEIAKHGDVAIFSLSPPRAWDSDGLLSAVADQRGEIDRLAAAMAVRNPPAQTPEDLVVRDQQYVWHPYTPLRGVDPPLPVVGACDEFLTLADGRKLIDAISSWWTILHGHRHPRLMDALSRASEQFDHVMFAGITHEPAVKCAELLLDTVPWKGGRVFFSDNGSTAVEVALKMAYQYWCHRGEPHRKLFIGFEGAYHGDTFGAMAVGRDPTFFGTFEPLLFEAVHLPVQPDLLDRFLSRRHAEVAAVAIEPLIQAAGGMRFHFPELLRNLYAVVRKHHVLFIADEVMTCGRTGSFWAHSLAGIEPDLICAGKTLAGGVLPLAATLASPAIVEAFDSEDRRKTLFHGHSFTAHPLACAVAVENLRIMASDQFRKTSKRVEDFWQLSVAANKIRDLPRVINFRVCGTVLAMDIYAAGGYLSEVAGPIRKVAEDTGVFLRPLGNVVYAMPPLCTTDESLARIVEAIRRGILALGHLWLNTC